MKELLPALALIPMVGAVAASLIGRRSPRARDAAARVTTLLTLALSVWALVRVVRGETLSCTLSGLFGFGLSFRLDGFRAIYGVIAAFMWAATTQFSGEYLAHDEKRGRYHFFNLFTLGATMGVFLSNDLFTTFIFFEMMSFASYPWVAQEETPDAMRAAQTYLAVAVLGGMVTLMGLFLLYAKCGTLAFAGLRSVCAGMPKGDLYLCGALIAFGFGAKAGAFPMHIWLPKAHPVAPAPASALLSGILTKTGVFGLIVTAANLFYGDKAWSDAMLAVGCVTMFLGGVLALFSVDLKRTLACSSMSQIGFILVGIGAQGLLGAHGTLAAAGTVLHMVNHSLIKLTLFLCAGCVYMNLHKLNLNDVRGFGRKKPLLHAAFLLGALGISGVPLLNGYVSKSLIHEGLLEAIALLGEEGLGASALLPYRFAEKLFVVTGGLTAAYMTKLYVCLFWEKNADAAVQARYDGMKRYMNARSAIAIGVSAAALPVLGLLPDVFATRIADLSAPFLNARGALHAAFFSGENLLGAAKSLLVAAVVYLGVVRLWLMPRAENGLRVYADRWPKWLDLEDALYRPLVCGALPAVFGAICGALDRVLDCALVRRVIPAIVTFFTRALDELADSLAVLLSRKVLHAPRKREPVPVGNRFTYAMGCAFNFIAYLLNRTVYRNHPITTDFVTAFAAGRDEVTQATRTLTRSLSFGLLMLCVGLVVTFIYLLGR